MLPQLHDSLNWVLRNDMIINPQHTVYIHLIVYGVSNNTVSEDLPEECLQGNFPLAALSAAGKPEDDDE